jgi:prepilin-type processing-associated H-X9-DG protein
MYLNDFDEFFPLAWHEGSGSTVDTVTYNRFLIQVACDTNFASIEAEDDARKVEMLEQNVRFWSDPVEGLTDDYFSPPAIFRLPAPEERDKPYSKHTLYRAVTSRVVPVSMPFLADAAASTPRPDAEDAPPETRSGLAGAFKPAAFTFGDESYHAFYGVAKSWSRWDPDADLSEWNGTQNWGSGEERFDFRHNGAINVLFLDGHVDTIKKTHGDRLTKLHDNWNIDSEGAP